MKPEIWLSFSEIKTTALLYQKQLLRIFMGTLVVSVLWGILKPKEFSAYATFRQSSQKMQQGPDIKHFFRALSEGSEEISAQTIFYSKAVWRRTIENLGLQISSPRGFIFEKVSYEGELKETLFFRVLDPLTFEVTNQKKQTSKEGKIGYPFTFDEVTFTCLQVPTSIKASVPLCISPWRDVAASLQKNLFISPSKQSQHVLELKFVDSDRHRAALVLNSLMDSYQQFLIDENTLFIDQQLTYLRLRKQELEKQFDQTLEENVSYLTQNLGETGFISLAQELETLSLPKETYTSKLFDLQLELSRFQETVPSSLPSKSIDLESRLSLLSSEEKRLLDAQASSDAHQKLEAETLLHSLEEETPLPSVSHIPFASLVQSLLESKEAMQTAPIGEKTVREKAFKQARFHLIENLRDFIHSLHLKQEMIQSSSIYAQGVESDFHGLNLQTAQQLYVRYQSDLDRFHHSLKELLYLRSQLQNPSFDLGSMAASSLDPITQKMIEKASDLEIQLQDVIHRSPREHERIKDALNMQKKYVDAHIGQTIDLHKIRIEITREKIGSLKKIILDLLQSEKTLVEQKLSDLKTRMSTLPQKWRMEHLLKLKTDLMKKIVEGLVQVTETKILNRHLFNIESRPIDRAFAPLKPDSKHLFGFSLLASLTALFGSFLFLLVKVLLNGTAPSLKTLQVSGLSTMGCLSKTCDQALENLSTQDLETLRRIILSMDGASLPLCATLFLGPYLDFSKPLKDLCSQYSLKAIVIDCNMSKIPLRQSSEGLLDYLTGAISTLPIDHDIILSGGPTRFSSELLASTRFRDLITHLKSHYDLIFLISSASLNSTEASQLLSCADHVFVSYSHETTVDLVSFSRQKETRKVSFIQMPIIT